MTDEFLPGIAPDKGRCLAQITLPPWKDPLSQLVDVWYRAPTSLSQSQQLWEGFPAPMAPEGLAEASIAAALPLNSLCLILLPSPLISILSKTLLAGKSQSLRVYFPSGTIYNRDFGAESHAAKRNQSWIFLGRTDAEAEAPILWPSDGKCWLIGKDPDAGKDWGQEERQVTEDEMTVWHHLFNWHEFEQDLGDKEGQWSLVCCCPWGRKESDMT